MRNLPPSMRAERQELAGYAEAVIRGCLAHERPDHCFHNVVDDPGSFVECNLSQMLAYAIYLGVTAGWLDPRWRGRADALREAARARVDAEGRVQGVCGAPHFDRVGTAPEAQAFYLLMEAAAGTA